ncbi:diaminopimelate epimerase [Amycolatopsis sp. WGS_07]|uniref:diaminopimelate epimerase n=1 Tax=Amycolatopsis sp. WGS_07 TaxID=3076764 RepID=UPI0038731B22
MSPSLPFTKMHGCGNDFVVLDLRDAPAPSPELCRALADRHTGVGCDLILGIRPPRSASAVAAFEIWTGDGESSMQCGNGARCVASWLVQAGLARPPSFEIDSPSGTHPVEVLGDSVFSIGLTVPEFEPERIPLSGFPSRDDRYEAELADGTPVRFAAASTGNPHVVLEVDDAGSAPVARLGPAVRALPGLPPTVNVGFAEVVARDRIRLRVHEFGAGETLACGSGACAAAAVLIRAGRLDRDVTVEVPGGELRIGWPAEGEPIVLAGPATTVYEGGFRHAAVLQHS